MKKSYYLLLNGATNYILRISNPILYLLFSMFFFGYNVVHAACPPGDGTNASGQKIIYFGLASDVTNAGAPLGSFANPLTDWNSSNGGMDAINDCSGNVEMRFIPHCNYSSASAGGDMTFTDQFVNASINNVTIDGQGSVVTNSAAAASWIRVVNRDNWTIKNFTFKGYNANAILLTDMDNAVIDNCIFDSNPTQRALRIDTDSDANTHHVTISNCLFANNPPVSETPSTGAVEILQGEFDGQLTVDIIDTDFKCNGRQGIAGGALWISEVDPSATTTFLRVNISGGTFENNRSTTNTGSGGAIGFRTEGILTIDGTTFIDNYSTADSGTEGGGAIYYSGDTGNTGYFQCDNAVFESNTTTSGAGTNGCGGAVNLRGTYPSATFTNCIFSNNVGAKGGAIYGRNSANISLNNCLFENNDTHALYSDAPTFTLSNSTITGSTTAFSGASNLTNSLVCGNGAVGTAPTITDPGTTVVQDGVAGDCASPGSAGSNLTNPNLVASSACPFSAALCEASGGADITIAGCTYFCADGSTVPAAASGNAGFNVTGVSSWISPCVLTDYTYVFLVVNSSGTIVQIINGDTDGDGIPNFAEIPAVNTLIDLDINSLPPDTYTVYGFSYRIAPIADAYSPVPAVGQTLSSHQANITAGQCASLSTGAISTIVLNPIVVEATTRCPAVPDGTFFIDVTNVTGGLPEELGIGSYSITNVPGVASYTYGAGTVSSSAITYSSGATIDITALDNNNPDGGDATCVDCSSVVLTLNHLSCVLTSDLQLIKTVNNATPNVGETVTFTITVHNNGPDDATGVAVTDTIPNGYTNIQSISGAGSLSGNNITWSGLSIANGADAVLTFMAEIAAPLNGVTYVNISEITASSNIDPDSTPNDNTETSGDIGSVDNDGTQDITDQDDVDDALVTPLQSDLSLVKTVSASTVNVNDVVTFTITVHNAGPDTATNITVKDVVPLGYTNITSITPSGSLTGQTINWNIASLAVGADAVLSFQSTVTATDSYINIAEIIAVDQFDPDSSPNNNVATSGNIGSEDADGTQNTTLGDPAGEDDVDDAAVSIAPVCNPNVGTWAN